MSTQVSRRDRVTGIPAVLRYTAVGKWRGPSARCRPQQLCEWLAGQLAGTASS